MHKRILLSLFSITDFAKAVWILTGRQNQGLFTYFFFFFGNLNTTTAFLPLCGELMLINFSFQSVTQDPPPALNCPLLTETEFCTITYQDNLILQNRTCA